MGSTNHRHVQRSYWGLAIKSHGKKVAATARSPHRGNIRVGRYCKYSAVSQQPTGRRVFKGPISWANIMGNVASISSSSVVVAATISLKGWQALIFGLALGAVGYGLGLLLSAMFDLPSGAVIVWSLATTCLLGSSLIKPHIRLSKVPN